MSRLPDSTDCRSITPASAALAIPVPLPRYLEQIYWWAYLHPRAVRIFERQWLVNLILWGHYARLRDAAIAEMLQPVAAKVLQVACVYGDFTERLVQRLTAPGSVDVVDVAPCSSTT